MRYVPPINGDISDPDRGYINADPATGQEGSIPPAAALEHPQREVINAIIAGDVTPDPADLTQLAQSIANQIAAAINALNLLIDLSDPTLEGILPVAKGGTGAATPPDARASLGAAAADHGHDIPGIVGLVAALSALVPITRTLTTGSGLTGGGDLASNRTLALAYATQAQAEAGTDTAGAMNSLRVAQAIAAQALIRAGDAVALSGTAVTISGIPAGARRVQLLWQAAALHTAADMLIQLGAGSVVTSGYDTATTRVSIGSGAGVSYTIRSTNGWAVDYVTNTTPRHGLITLVRGAGQTWTGEVRSINTDATYAQSYGMGHVTLSGPLDRIRLTTGTGTAAFSGGTALLLWEM